MTRTAGGPGRWTRRSESFPTAIKVFILLLAGAPAAAHHSFAMFDREHKVTIRGTVKEFQWTNPHVWIQLIVVEEGKSVEYSIEGSSPNNLVRNGWSRTSLKPGDEISVLMNPLRNGDKGGSFVSATLADGAILQP